MATIACPDVLLYQQLAAGKLPDAKKESLLIHLDECDQCAKRLGTAASKATITDLLRQAKTLKTGEPDHASPRANGPGSLGLADREEATMAPRETLQVPLVAFACAGCGKRLKVNATLAGKKVKCPGCKASIPVPGAAPDIAAQTITQAPGAVLNETAREASPTHTGHGHNAPDPELYDFLAPAESPDELGRLGPYRILGVLGAGGMGVVFRAEDPQLKRALALKAMLPALAASASAKKRFLREAQSAAAIEHDHIVPIFQVGEDRGVPFIAMPFLKGEPLDECLKREGKLPPAEVIRIGREIAEGLAAAHERGLIHRDIKPANVWLEGNKRRVKILDFGLARAADETAQLTQAGAIIGTPAYMAPEQAGGQEVDHRCDLFSLGCLLYRVCTGVLPFQGADTISTLMAVATENPSAPHAVDPAVPPELSDLVMRLLEKRASDRPATSQEVATTLAALAEDGTAGPRLRSNSARGRRSKESKGRPRWLLPAAALGLFALVPLLWLLSTVILRVETEDGTLIVEIKDDKVEARYKDGKLILTGPDGKDRYTLAPGERSKKLEAGPYKIRVEGADGLTLDTSEFTLRKNGEVTVRVTFEPKVAVAAKKDAPGLDPDLKHGGKGIASKKSPKVFNETAAREILDRILKAGGQVAFVTELPVSEGWAGVYMQTKKIEDVSLLTVEELRRPFSVQLSGVTGFTNEDFDRLGHLPIWQLLVSNMPISDESLKCLDQLRQLRVLVLIGVPMVTDESIARLAGMDELKMLHCAAVKITDDGLNPLARLPKLATLFLDYSSVTTKGLSNLKGLSSLRNLRFRPNFGDVQPWPLSDLPQLKQLTISGDVTDAQLEQLSELTGLEVLFLSTSASSATGGRIEFNITGVCLNGGLPNLTQLVLAQTKFGDKEMQMIKKMPRLKNLSLSSTRITDASLEHLKDLRELQVLSLRDTVIGDAGLVHLEGMSHLTSLDLQKTKVTEAAVQQLRKALPSCRVTH